jgi:hypothetical protein
MLVILKMGAGVHDGRLIRLESSVSATETTTAFPQAVHRMFLSAI